MNPINLLDSAVMMPLNKGKFILIDSDDFERVNQWKWALIFQGNNFYASRATKVDGKYKSVYLHRFLMNTPKHLQTDHVNGNGLDNRKQNLRVCTRSQNFYNKKISRNNTSGSKNISWETKKKSWCIQLFKDNKRIFQKRTKSLERAISIRNEAIQKYYGEYGRLN